MLGLKYKGDYKRMKIVIGIVVTLAVWVLMAYAVKHILNLVKLPSVPVEYAQKRPVLICRYNSLLACFIFLLPVALFLVMFWGAITNFKTDGVGESFWWLLFCSLLCLEFCVFLWMLIANSVFVFYEGGLVYRDLLGKVHCVADKDVRYVYMLEYRVESGSRSFIRIKTSGRMISISSIATNYYEAQEYVRRIYPSKDAYDRLQKEKMSEQVRSQQREVRISVKEAQNCLLQQTTSYQRDCPILFATNAQNELFLVYYFQNTFYISKAEYGNGKLTITYDYRRKHPGLKGFEYRNEGGRVTATLSLHGAEVEFVLQSDFEYHGMGCTVLVNQTEFYADFMKHIEVYHKNINGTSEMLSHKPDHQELLEKTKKMSSKEKEEVQELLEQGKPLEAIKKLRDATGLGLAECKRIVDNHHLYL